MQLVSTGGMWSSMKKRIDNVDVSLGRRLSEMRKASGLTQTELAKKARTSQQMIAYYERGLGSPPAALLPRLAKTLGVSADKLLGLEQTDISGWPKTARTMKQIRRFVELNRTDRQIVLNILEGCLRRQTEKRERRNGRNNGNGRHVAA